MSEPKFTPGPWVVNRDDDGGGDINWAVVADGRGLDIVRVPELVHPKNARANANLIAAAPDLYVACAIVLEAVASGSENHMKLAARECRRALAKARGEKIRYQTLKELLEDPE